MGRNYEISEAVEWFLDGACDRTGVPVPDYLRHAWETWDKKCAELWAHRCGGVTRPETFSVDAMHQAQGAGVGVWDRDYYHELPERTQAILRESLDMFHLFRTNLHDPIYVAFSAFEDALSSATDEAQ